MNKEHGSNDGLIMPEELAMLQSVFDDLLAVNGHDRQSIEAELIATRIINLFLSGIRSQDALRRQVTNAPAPGSGPGRRQAGTVPGP